MRSLKTLREHTHTSRILKEEKRVVKNCSKNIVNKNKSLLTEK